MMIPFHHLWIVEYSIAEASADQEGEDVLVHGGEGEGKVEGAWGGADVSIIIIVDCGVVNAVAPQNKGKDQV